MAKKKASVPALEKVKEKKKIDPLLVFRTQPAGNLKLDDERYIKTGDGYASCIQVYEYPGSAYDFWLMHLINYDGVFTTIDIATQDKDAAIEAMSRSLEELGDRYGNSQSASSSIDDGADYKKMYGLLTAVKTQGETVKQIVTRIYVPGRTKEEVDTRVNEIISDLESNEYRAAVYLNETDCQYKAMFQPYEKQHKERDKIVATPLPAESLAGGYPFNFESLDDPYGVYYGSTLTGGNVIWDIFHKTAQRMSYDTLLVGKKGAGKSTTMKMIVENNFLVGNFVRILDIVGEYSKMVRGLGGVIISIGGADGILNPMEAFRVSDSEVNNFAAQLSKLNTMYGFISPSSSEDERNEFEECVRLLYAAWGLWDSESSSEDQQITGHAPEDYPTFKDLLEIVRDELYEDVNAKKVNPNLSPSRWQRLESIELTLRNLVNSYPMLFAQTTTVPDVTKERIILYNVQGISNLKTELFDALLFNIMSMMMDDMIRIGGPSKELYEHGMPLKNVPKLLLVMDEAHRFVSARNPMALDYMVNLVQEDRKFFTSLLLASPSIRNFVLESSGETMDKLKTLFELFQYKVIMKQDSNVLTLLRSIFEQDLTESQLYALPGFGQGDCLLMTGEDTIRAHIRPTEAELNAFSGGA